jgi:multidrug transporter EmrE-like cation transporter
MGYFFIALTVLLTLYGQLVLKWQVGLAGPLPEGIAGKATFLMHALLNPWILSGLGAAFVASLCWMLALSKLPLSTAYPFTATSFLLIFVFSTAFLGEPVTSAKLIGTLLITAGVVIMAFNS